jgi:hypothetical protein
MNDRHVSLAMLIPAALSVVSLAILIVVGMRLVEYEWGFLGMALCIAASVCHVHCRIERLAAREVQAFEFGRESVRSIR